MIKVQRYIGILIFDYTDNTFQGCLKNIIIIIM